MRPPRIIPLLLAVFAAWPSPAVAQVKTNVGAEAASGATGSVGASFNAGGVAPISLTGAAISPLSLTGTLSPALAAPAISPSQGLAPSALVQARPSAALADKPLPRSAAVAAAPSASAASRPSAPANPVAAAAAPAESPYFAQTLAKLQVPAALIARLQSFLATRHPGEQDKIYHGLDHSNEVADLTARLVDGQNLPNEKKVLLILSAALHDIDPERGLNTPARVSATLGHLDADDEAQALLSDFGGRYGFTAAQVKAMVLATDFALDPVQMKAKQDAFEAAAKEAFSGEADWALNWGRRLAFADQASTYVGSQADARKRVEGLAVELRAQLEELGKGPGPSNEVILAGTYKFLTALRENPLFALLPPEQSRNFDGVRSYFESRQTPEAWAAESAPAPARAPPVNPDLDSARRFIRGIMGGVRAPTERETDSLLSDWLEENEIPRNSPRAVAVRQALVPGKTQLETATAAALTPKLRRHAGLLLRLAAENKVSVAYIESVMAKRGLLENLDAIPDSSLENQIEIALTSDALERAVAGYPDNAQGGLMRGVASAMATKGGKSVEEVARDGVFLYADFNGGTFMRGYASRDPDVQLHTIAFYVTRRNDKWRIDGYRQKVNGRVSDQFYIDALKAWLRKGGIPAADFQ